jgi:hypothetical protein
MLLFPVTYDVASVAVEPEISNVIYSTNKQLCELFLLQKKQFSQNQSTTVFLVSWYYMVVLILINDFIYNKIKVRL